MSANGISKCRKSRTQPLAILDAHHEECNHSIFAWLVRRWSEVSANLISHDCRNGGIDWSCGVRCSPHNSYPYPGKVIGREDVCTLLSGPDQNRQFVGS